MKRSANPKLLLVGMLFMAAMAFVAGGFGLSERRHLLRDGVEATGVVVGIDVGAKGLRSVEVKFTAANGHEVVGRDVHQTQWLDANEIGEHVTLYFDLEDPEKILISRGFSMWLNPALFLAGGVFLCGLALFIYKHSRASQTS